MSESSSPPTSKSGFLFKLSSFDCGTNADGTRIVGVNSPPMLATIQTVMVGVLFLFFTEHLCRFIFSNLQHLHPLLENELNRMILARHMGVDVVGTGTVAYLGIRNRHICRDFYETAIKRKNNLPAAAFDKRLFTYIPEGHQIALYFLIFQLKNTYDTIVFNDGPEYVLHHILSLTAAWWGMYPGIGHVYVMFFMGLSEVSTCVLSLLANFDDFYGVAGLGDAFPLMKVFVGVIFVIFFIICRVIMWPYFTYHWDRDCLNALKSGSTLSKERKVCIWGLLIANSGVSLLQVVWLGQIIIIAQEEIGKIL